MYNVYKLWANLYYMSIPYAETFKFYLKKSKDGNKITSSWLFN